MAEKVEKVKKTTVKASRKSAPGPKRPMTAFFWFLQKRRPELIEERPELKKAVKEVAKLVGEEWSNMSPEQKSKWTDMAAEAKKRYAKDKAAFDAKEEASAAKDAE
ncbi:HMG (high mobility group) box protein [Gregarina niphandrodes]|uniref:HMG (High mobility group) box protein n=1 Tax=Gregarina niphandrodes TaxID=110365 RepID=A0A023B5D3_GRENI|nr:HMG (high mobility group) box protein [Gregarina niphandrodes]EZG59760.1 HMG (high mobility group) box protein [Gregarina niphandrodes]|eukprot:XP_011130874.1 HMG (high mobility group) box protein [Gregarina niphandrodes]